MTVERQRILLVKRRPASTPVWCEICAEHPQMLTLDEAASLLGMTQRDIFQRVEGRKAHFTEIADGRLYVCGISLRD